MSPETVSAIATSVATVVAALALVAAFAQVRHLRRQIAADLGWRRREKAFSYSQIHHPEVQAARSRVASCFPNAQAPISGSQLETAQRKDGSTLAADMRTILIHLENIGLAVRHDVADFTVLYDMNGIDTIRFCHMYEAYIQFVRADADNPRLWENVGYLAGRFAQERDARAAAGCSAPPAAGSSWLSRSTTWARRRWAG